MLALRKLNELEENIEKHFNTPTKNCKSKHIDIVKNKEKFLN
jgi:hypothetical protein